MKILVIGAHPDDNEFRVGGMAAKWVKAGYSVRFLSVANGNGGHHIMTPEETRIRRFGEAQAVAKLLGVEYDIWDINDCEIMADLKTRERMVCYIREYNPDLIISHRTNDYHADHRAVAQLVQDASYLLTVPHTCPKTPAMRFMPVIVYNEDEFKNPDFVGNYVVGIDDEIEIKLNASMLNESQVFEWLPYTYGQTVPTDKDEREKWFRGIDTNKKHSDKQINALSADNGYAIRFAKTAARFRKELIKHYGRKQGKKIRYAEAFELCAYGTIPDKEFENKMFWL